jgi:antirestriction protein ArdC
MASHKPRDIYQEVTDRIIQALEQGTAPWVRPWSVESDPFPINAASHRRYRGINTLLLHLTALQCGYARNRWLTYRQALSIGAQVRRGEHGVGIVFFRVLEINPEDQLSRIKKGQDASGNEDTPRSVRLLRLFTVFNVAQIEDLPARLTEPEAVIGWDMVSAAEAIIQSSGADIRYGGNAAFYSPGPDRIHLPPRAAFKQAEDFYATALHELTHWSAHPTRCARPLNPKGHPGYAFEELIAELGSAYLCAHCRLDGELHHPEYISHWLEALRADKRAIFTASAQAQKAADYLLAKLPQAPDQATALSEPDGTDDESP